MSVPKEILTARPRPGGPIQCQDTSSISIPPPRQLGDNKKPEENTPSRRYRINQVVTSTPWNYIKAKEKEGEIKPNTLENASKLLSVAISTIMLLATNNGNIPKTNLKWTYNYLRLIKDEAGQNPPNVQGILNHIQHVTGGADLSITNDGSREEPRNLDTEAKKDEEWVETEPQETEEAV